MPSRQRYPQVAGELTLNVLIWLWHHLIVDVHDGSTLKVAHVLASRVQLASRWSCSTPVAVSTTAKFDKYCSRNHLSLVSVVPVASLQSCSHLIEVSRQL